MDFGGESGEAVYCWQTSNTTGDAQCTTNCVRVTAANGTSFYPVVSMADDADSLRAEAFTGLQLDLWEPDRCKRSTVVHCAVVDWRVEQHCFRNGRTKQHQYFYSREHRQPFTSRQCLDWRSHGRLGVECGHFGIRQQWLARITWYLLSDMWTRNASLDVNWGRSLSDVTGRSSQCLWTASPRQVHWAESAPFMSMIFHVIWEKMRYRNVQDQGSIQLVLLSAKTIEGTRYEKAPSCSDSVPYRDISNQLDRTKISSQNRGVPFLNSPRTYPPSAAYPQGNSQYH